MIADGTRVSKSAVHSAPTPFSSLRPIDLAVVLPAFNEVQGIAVTFQRVEEVLSGLDCTSEILVVDDGSTDGTAAAAARLGARVISHPVNRGYGTALKTGILNTTAAAVLIMDSDCSYRPEAIPGLYALLANADMVVGSRPLTSTGVLWVRRPGKWILNTFASFLVGRRVPDLNSGQRVMKRDAVMQYLHLMPDGFSFTSTITLAMLANGHNVIYEPIAYDERIGDSKIRAVHFLDFLVLILRATVLFNPIRVYLPLSGLFALAGTGLLLRDILRWRLSPTTVMSFLFALLGLSVGLLADAISRMQANQPRPPGT